MELTIRKYLFFVVYCGIRNTSRSTEGNQDLKNAFGAIMTEEIDSTDTTTENPTLGIDEVESVTISDTLEHQIGTETPQDVVDHKEEEAKESKPKKTKPEPEPEICEPLEGYDEVLKNKELHSTSPKCPRRPCYSGSTKHIDKGTWKAKKRSAEKTYEIRECNRCGGRFAREL